MKKIFILIIFAFSIAFVNAANPHVKDTILNANSENEAQLMASYDDEGFKIIKASDVDIMKSEIKTSPKNIEKTMSPGGIPSFLWSFVLSAIGGFTIYGLGLGPLSVLIVYFASGKNKKEVKKSIWGWITGTLVGVGLWILLKVIQHG